MLDTVKEIRPPDHHCEHPKGWNHYNCDHGTDVWVPRRCRRCEACKQAKIGMHASRVRHGLEVLQHAAMLTLTTRPGTEWSNISSAWTSFLWWIRKRQPDVQFAAAREIAPDNGMFHMHIALAPWAYLPQSALSMAWRNRVSAPVVWIQAAEPGRAADEISKYLAKATPQLPRAINYSRAWPKQPPPDKLHFIESACVVEVDDIVTATTRSGYLIGDAPAACECFAGSEPITDGSRIWLEYKRDRWSKMLQAGLPVWSFGEHDSGSSPKV